MSPDRDSRYTPDEPDDDYEDDPPRSIFSAAWFRVVVVLLGIGVVGAVAVPYVLDVVNPPIEPLKPLASAPRPAPIPPVAPAPTTPPVVAPAPTATPAPTAPPPTAAPAKPIEPAPKAGMQSAEPASKPPARASEPAPKAAAKTDPAPKAATKASEPAPAPSAMKDPPRVAAAPSAPPRPRAAEGGDWFVQVGAFKEQEAARRVAAKLRDDKYPVDESVKRVGGGAAAPAPAPRPAPRSAAPAGPDRYDVLVSGGTAADINSKLAAKGLASEPAADGVRIRPSLPLRDAVALSKDLGTEGFKVQVRRAGGGASEPAPAAPAPRVASGGDGGVLYRVRVGGYPDRAAANRVMRELQEKGYQPFVARGRE